MAGALVQLVAYGVQDVYLTGNPQITFFKVVYRRHTNFACEAIEQSFSGNADFGKSSVSAIIARNGDLIHRMYLKAEVSLSCKTGKCGFVRNLGHSMLNEYEVQIGGSRIDRQTGDFMNFQQSL